MIRPPMPNDSDHVGQVPAGTVSIIYVLDFHWSGGSNNHGANSLTHKAALQLLGTCRLFTVIHENPLPWNQIVLDLDHRNEFPEIRAWFSRAADKPISLIINLTARGFIRANLLTHVPWSHLTQLELNNDTALPLNVSRSVLSSCTKLVSCTLNGVNGWPASVRLPIPDSPPICLPHLRHLIIKFYSVSSDDASNDPTEISPLFQPLILPALEELEIRATHSSFDPTLCSALIKVQSQSPFPLVRLQLVGVYFEVEDLRKFLRHTPTLKNLHLESTTMIHQFSRLLGALEYVPSISRNVLPNLEQLVIVDNGYRELWHALDEVVIQFLETRWWSPIRRPYRERGLSRLKNAAVVWRDQSQAPWPSNPDATVRVQRLVTEGMQLVYPSLGIHQ